MIHTWIKCKILFIASDEKSGAEKKTASYVLVQIADTNDASKKSDEGMKGTLADYRVESISQTKITDVYSYGKADE